MRTLTAKEITDIIFQKPDRITAGVLDRIPSHEKLFNKLARPYKEFVTDYSTQNYSHIKLSLGERLAFHYWQDKKYRHPQKNDQRSILTSIFELRAIGFSKKQLYVLASHIYRFSNLQTAMKWDHNSALRSNTYTKMGLKPPFDNIFIVSDSTTHMGVGVFEELDNNSRIIYHGSYTNGVDQKELAEDLLTYVTHITNETPQLLTPHNQTKAKRIPAL